MLGCTEVDLENMEVVVVEEGEEETEEEKAEDEGAPSVTEPSSSCFRATQP